MHKTLIAIAILVVILVAGFFALNSYIYTEKQGTGEVTEPYRASLEGEFVCLPHKDTTGPQTDECASGIKTDAGEHYAVDFNLSSQGGLAFQVGKRFSGNGVLTPIERMSASHWQKYDVEGVFSVTDSATIDGVEQGYVCQMDAKICPDGSSVGRTGPSCTFAACPSPDATSARVTTSLGGSSTALTVTVSPEEVISDSRCPVEVQCIWAGTVEVRTTLSTPVSHGEHVLKLGESQAFGDYTVTLVEVTPAKTQEAIADSSYRFTYEIRK